MRDRLVDCRFRDLVKDHPLDCDPWREYLEEVPGDRLSLSVLICREIDLGGVLYQTLKLLDLLDPARRDDIKRFEVIVDIDSETRPGLSFVGGWDLLG